MGLGKFPEAERAFTRYIRLVPDEANPYDSYAELLMKEGRFDESITMYEKALSVNPRFYSAHVGIADNLTFKGLTVDARKQLQKLDETAQTDSWRRVVLTGMARTYVAEGKYDKAVEELRKRHAIAVKNRDDLTAANDLVLIGDVQLESSGVDATKGTYFKTRTPELTKLNEAKTSFTDALNTISNSNLSQDIKDGIRQVCLSRQVEIAVRNNDLATAKAQTDEYREAAVKRGNPVEMQTAHSLAALVAISEKRYQDAVNELKQSASNDPKVLFHLAEAYDALGNTVSAQDVRNKITRMNDTSVSYTMIRRSVTP